MHIPIEVLAVFIVVFLGMICLLFTAGENIDKQNRQINDYKAKMQRANTKVLELTMELADEKEGRGGDTATVAGRVGKGESN